MLFLRNRNFVGRVLPLGCLAAIAGALSWVSLASFPLQGQEAPADLILRNGKVLTVDANFTIAQAVAVRGNEIAAVGTDAQVMPLAGPNTRVIDLKGRTVIPGLIDTHRHMYNYAERSYGGQFDPHQLKRYPIDWRGVSSTEDVLNQVKALIDKYKFPPGQWIYFVNQLNFIRAGTGEQAKILYNDLTRWELDKVTPNNPVAMTIGIPDFNGVILNSKAIDLIWGQHEDFLKQNGRYWIDAQGRPEGHLEPPASRLVLPYTYNRDPEILSVMYKADAEENASMGITTISTRLPGDTLKAYELLQSRGQLSFRLGYGPIERFGNVTDLENGLQGVADLVGSGGENIWITAIGPTAVDGASTRACTDQKRVAAYGAIDGWYPFGQCHLDVEFNGAVGRTARITKNYFRDWVMASGREGIRFANVHVAGDRAVGLMLNNIEQVQRQYGREATKNWALDHCDMVNPADFARIARLGLFMSCYVANSVEDSEAVAKAYGEQVANTFLSPLKSMINAGVKVVFETDRASYIWTDLERGVTRKDLKGKVWGAQERVDKPTALRMVTSWAAEYVLKPDKLGTIQQGKLADLLVLDRDYLTIPDDDISEIQPLLTVMDGKIVFVNTQFAQEYNLRPAGAVVSTYKDLIQRRKVSEMISGAGG